MKKETIPIQGCCGWGDDLDEVLELEVEEEGDFGEGKSLLMKWKKEKEM